MPSKNKIKIKWQSIKHQINISHQITKRFICLYLFGFLRVFKWYFLCSIPFYNDIDIQSFYYNIFFCLVVELPKNETLLEGVGNFWIIYFMTFSNLLKINVNQFHVLINALVRLINCCLNCHKICEICLFFKRKWVNLEWKEIPEFRCG